MILILTLTAAVTAQITLQVNQLVIALDALGITIPANVIPTIIAAVDIDAIVEDITANVEVSLGILQLCLGLDVTVGPSEDNGGPPAAILPFQLPSVQQMNPTIQQNSQVLPSGNPMLQLQSSLSPIS